MRGAADLASRDALARAPQPLAGRGRARLPLGSSLARRSRSSPRLAGPGRRQSPAVARLPLERLLSLAAPDRARLRGSALPADRLEGDGAGAGPRELEPAARTIDVDPDQSSLSGPPAEPLDQDGGEACSAHGQGTPKVYFDCLCEHYVTPCLRGPACMGGFPAPNDVQETEDGHRCHDHSVKPGFKFPRKLSFQKVEPLLKPAFERFKPLLCAWVETGQVEGGHGPNIWAE